MDPIGLRKLYIHLWVWLRAQVYDGSESQGLEEAETNRFRKTGAEDSVINHGEVERRHEQLSIFVGVDRRVLRLRYGVNIAVVTIQRHGDDGNEEESLFAIKIFFFQREREREDNILRDS